jgi:cation/acetate symporter
VVWGLFFIALIYWSAPAYGVLGRLFEARAGIPFSPDPAAADMVVLSAVSNAGLPSWVVGLLVAGGMSAAFSTVAGLLLTGSSSFSHDIYPRLIRPSASENDKVYAAKGFFLLLAMVVMLLTFNPWGMIAEIAALAFALAGNTIFPAFLLGIWWDRANAAGVIAGMLTGLLITFLPFMINDSLPMISRLLPATSSAFIGAPVVIIVMVCVSLLTAAPSESIRRFLARDVHECTEE